MDSGDLFAAIKNVSPNITSVSVGDAADKTTWKMTFSASATAQEMADAQSAIDSYDPNSAAATDRQKSLVVLGISNALDFKLRLNIENRVRALEGKAAVTAAQYLAALKALL